MSVEEAVAADLAGLGDGANTTAGALALALAVEIDDPANSSTSKSMCARALMDAMAEVRELAPPQEEEDELDRARARRAARLEGQSTPETASPSARG